MSESVSSRDIAIIGYSCRFADADNIDQFWTNLVQGRASFKPVPADRWKHDSFYSTHSRKADKSYAKAGAFIDDIRSFPAMHFGIAPRRVETMDPQHRMVLDAVRVALQDAGLEASEGRYDPARVGTFLGVSTSEYANLTTSRTTALMMRDGQFGDAEHAEDALGHAVENVAPISAFSMTGILMNMAAANVAYQWKFKGPAYTVDAACASSLVAVHDGITNIRAGICDIAIAGGVYANLTPSTLVGFSRIGAISKTGVCRPFDANADGFVQGDGVGIVILKSLQCALADGDRIHAVIRGSGINNDGGASGPMAPAVEGQADVIRRAFADAGLEPGDVGYVQCHGTATKVGDPVEVNALRQVLGEDGGQPVYLGSVKAHIGHTMSAAGVAGLLHAVLNVERGIITPLPNFEAPNPELALEQSRFKVPTEAVSWERTDVPRRAGVSAFGFGGTNCHLIVEQAPVRQEPEVVQAPVQLVVVSADDRTLLAGAAIALAESIEEHDYTLADVAYTLNVTRRFETARLVIVALDRDDLLAKLRDAAIQLERNEALTLGPDTFATPATNEVAPITFMFQGQGAQRLGLMRDLYDTFPNFRERLDGFALVLKDVLALPLTHYIYPDLREAPVSNEVAEAELTATQNCQPVMAALGMTLAGWISDDFGIAPKFCIGHSLGEFVAAAMGGLLAPDEALRFVAERGRLMAGLEIDDPGAMAAIRANEAEVGMLLRGHPEVVIANINYPQQTVVSGPTACVETLVEELVRAQVKATVLNVSHAFHSDVISPVGEALQTFVQGLEFTEPQATVFSAISKAPYTVDTAAETFVAHATSPVDFMAALQECSAAGSTLFVEVGGGTTLTRFANGVLDRQTHYARTWASRETDQNLEFLRTLGVVTALGQPAILEPITPRGRVVSLPSTPLERQSYWIVREKKVPLAPAGQSIINSKEASVSKDGVSIESNNKVADATDGSNDALVSLFLQQNAILAEHARIMAAQTAMLTGQDVSFDAALSAQPAKALSTEATPYEPVLVDMPAKPARPEYDFTEIVFEAVAQVSAFPKEALKLEQQLATDLGFDSLMFVDLGTELQKAVPSLGPIPQDAFEMKTRISDVVVFMESHTSTGQAVAEIDTTLRRYKTTLVPRQLAWLPGESPFAPGSTVAVTADDQGVAEALIEALKNTQAEFILVEGNSLPEGTKSLLHVAGLNVRVSAEDAFAGQIAHPAEDFRALASELYRTSGGRPEAVVVLTSDASPFQAGLTAMGKSLAREWPRSLVRTIRTDGDRPDADTIRAELYGASQDIEVVYNANGRHVVALSEDVFTSDSPGFTRDDVVLFTGGGRGIGAKIAIELARRSQPKLIIVGRTKAVRLSSETKANIAAMKKHGSEVVYLGWDVTKPATAADSDVLLGVTAVVHAAGLIRDAEVQTKSAKDFAAVTSVKVEGLINVVGAVDLTHVKTVVSFGSWAGRFGNRGQTDYAAANAVMGALTQSLQSETLRATVIEWPAWETSEMVKSIPESVQEAMRAQGVTFVSDTDGVDAFFKELESDGTQSLYGVNLPSELRTLRSRWGLSTQTHPYLNDHILRDKPVLPFASALDYIAITAQNAIGNGPFEIRDLTLYRGVEVDKPVTLHVRADCVVNGERHADVEIKCERDDQLFVAYGGAYIAGRPQMPEISVLKEGTTKGAHSEMSLEVFYAKHAFHGERLQAIERIEETGESHLIGWVKTSTPPDLLNGTHRTRWAVDPLAVDGAMQLVLYWLQSRRDMAAFPTSFESYVQIAPFPANGLVRTTMVLHEADPQKVIGSIIFEDTDGQLLATMSRLHARVFELESAADTVGPEADTVGPAADTVGPDIPEELWKITAFPEVEALAQRLEMAKLMGIRNPYFVTHEGVAKNTAVIDGQPMINFSSYNYLGFSGHVDVSSAAKQAVDDYGTSVSASRLASGQIPIHKDLETALADFMGVGGALVFSAGHATNESVIGHLFGEGDLIVHDSLAHNSILTGAALSGAKRMAFKHNDYNDLERILKQLRTAYKKVGIMIEGVYSMDGDIPALAKFIALKKRYKCLLYVDEAHSLGTIGPRGAGISDYYGIDANEVDCWMGTLSKSFASCGGFVAASKELIDYLKYTVPGFIFSAGISPANSAAALAAVRLLAAHPEVPQLLQARSRYFLQVCKDRGIDTGLSHDSAVVPCIVGNSLDCLKLSEKLADRGINVQPIVYPAVDDGESRLRFFLSSTHSEEELLQTAIAIDEELSAIRSGAAAE